MQLSRLEIKGFKSFGDKVQINFDKGITGIVGPNGCGKSNIVDAIRWVLGEQRTRALRSDKMENVIFNGTKNRKPLQMAEVSMTFKNTKGLLPTEYSEVTITRRYYRSGESEYLLNGVTCRLKDINDLFLDTGIGPDSYAIIELKMVDDILNDKDNSRRELFEEAAGISKFKLRKKQTLKKLAETDKDLERVEDVLFEIEKNLKSLERQAKQAEKYFQYKNQYKKYSIELAKISLDKDRQKLDLIRKQIEIETVNAESFNTESKKVDAEIEQLKADLILKEKLVASRQQALNDHVYKIRQQEGEKKIKNERLKYLRDKEESLQTQILTDKQFVELAYNELKQLRENFSQGQQTVEDIQEELENLKEEFEDQKEASTQVKAMINEENRIYENYKEELFQFKKSMEFSEMRVATLKEELEKTDTDQGTQNESLNVLEKRIQESASVIEQFTEELREIEERSIQIKSQIEQTSVQIDGVKDELQLLNRTIDSKQNEYNLTKSLVDNLEGFPEAIKFLKKNTQWVSDAHLVSDIVTCSEQHRVIIENFLEPIMNYYVVDDETQAYQAVQLLSKSARGKANFFVLEKFKDFEAMPKKEIPGAFHALEILQFEPKYESLLKYLLNDVYITTEENLHSLGGRKEVFVTDNGKLIRRDKSVSGGSVGLFEGKRIGRLKNLENLQLEIKDLTKDREKIKHTLENLQVKFSELKSLPLDEELQIKRRQINQQNEEYISLKLKEEQLRELIQSSGNKKEDIRNNIRILEEAVKKSTPKLELLESQVTNRLEKIEQLQNELVLQEEIYTQKSSQYNNKNLQYHQQLNRVQSLEHEITFKEQNADKSSERIERNSAELQKMDQEIQKLLSHPDLNEDDLVGLYQEKEAIEQGVHEAEKDFYAHRGQIDQLEQKSKDFQRKFQAATQSVMELQNSINEIKLGLSSIQERLKVEFDVDLNQLFLKEEDKEEMPTDISEIQTEIGKLRDHINKIGPINPMALEAYTEIKERFDFITAQRQDLFDAKNSLSKTIKEIDVVAKENFVTAFAQIKENFIRVFRSLFTDEDNCDLKLADEDDPLESAIDIIAKPKGKRPLTINQLSGGEKTLTAVALLFSIYLIKPAPFCIFDEVDAPLDDANIDKFNNIIREFSGESQFILVTHNKRTMSMTDVMYGVTMQEMGVSRLVPVDLKSIETIIQPV